MKFKDFSRLCEPCKLKQKHITNNPVHGFCFEINHIIDHYRLLPTATFFIDLVLLNGEINICSHFLKTKTAREGEDNERGWGGEGVE